MAFRKRPPEPYKCIKVPLKYIICDTKKLLILSDAVTRANKIVIKSYQLLRLFLLSKYHDAATIPIVNKKLLNMIFNIIQSNSNTIKDSTTSVYKELEALFTSHITDKENGKGLSQVLCSYINVEMITAFENNIKVHFFDYLNRFVNSYWKSKLGDTIKKDELKKELKKVKNDILTGQTDKLTCDVKYHDWLKSEIYNIIPKTFKSSYYYDIKVEPQKYVKYMIYQNVQLEKFGGKMYQFCPLRNNCIPHYIHLDNTTIIKLFVEGNKTRYTNDIEGTKKELWTNHFHTKKIDRIKLKNYAFDYAFHTDGYCASLRFIHIDEQVKKIKKQKKMRDGRKKADKKEVKKEVKKIEKIDKVDKKEDKNNQDEFQYIDDIKPDYFKGKNFVVVDPGKRDLLTMRNEKGIKLKYSNKQRLFETKRLKYHSLLANYKESLNITLHESKLNQVNSKTCDVSKFRDFIKVKNEVNKEVLSLYEKEKFRQYKWYTYINTKRSEDKLLNKIEKTYGKDVLIIHGDWSQGKQMSNFISTPNIGLKRKLRERFEVYNIDEYRTSKIHYKTEEECKNLWLPDLKGVRRKLHSVLTYKMENKRLGCVNRDQNACLNLIKVYKYYIEHQTRPLIYKRGPKNDTKQCRT